MEGLNFRSNFAAEIVKTMQLFDSIKRRFFRAGEVIVDNHVHPFFGAWGLCKYQFASLIWYNICDLLTDLVEDVKIENTGNLPAKATDDPIIKFTAFRAFVYAWGKTVLQRLFDEGFVVIGYDGNAGKFWQMNSDEYHTVNNDDITTAKPNDPNVRLYVMKSATFVTYKKSDREICRAYLNYIDDVLNGSATVSKRLGAVVVASPKNLNSAPTATVLTDEQKKKLEQDMRQDYGALSSQSNIMLLPREMAWQVINLAGLDLKTTEKLKNAILAIVDRIKIPANQVAIIDAQSSKQLANGSEIREGDKLKYKTFRRLFERTFVEMGADYGVRFTYTIDGEPIGESSEVVAK